MLIGGSLDCLLSNCDKKSYLVKIYRFVRFKLQTYFINKSKSNIIFVALNEYQENLLENRNLNYIKYKNKINAKSFLNSTDICKNNEIFYLGRGDPEKGIETIFYISSRYSVTAIGGMNSINNPNLKTLPWISSSKRINTILSNNARVVIFPSIWLEADPLVPWEVMSLGIPVIASKDNVFGQYLSLHIPELVYSNYKDLDDILSKIFNNHYLNKLIKKVKFVYKEESKKREKYEKNLF